MKGTFTTCPRCDRIWPKPVNWCSDCSFEQRFYKRKGGEGLTYCFNISPQYRLQWRVVVHKLVNNGEVESVIKRFAPNGYRQWDDMIRLPGIMLSPKILQEELDKYLVLI